MQEQVAATKAPDKLFSEQCESLMFPDLRTEMDTADTAAARTPQNALRRGELVFAQALYRDAMYGHAGRAHLRALGVHNGFRAMYDLAKNAVNGGAAVA